ncbi:MAG: preprotein translocase subunit SecG [Deltaproteobacteria bacterium]|nr:preprotein translocase subunit SecG [Deltaproteobacteria bacterium]MBI3016794.1 preprotein translocase subunit SecG [Deltaproteobacteria bacterium]
MVSLVIILHVFVCVLLILVVLLQAGKGADMGSTFGAGGSQTVFGSGGAAPFLTKLTTAVAVIFMLTSIGLTILSARGAKKSVVEGITAPQTSEPKAPESTPQPKK